ncbi:hypothetical protein ACS0TY_021872 [Phlomoides rotata]
MLRTPPTELNYADHINLHFADPHLPSTEFGGRLHLIKWLLNISSQASLKIEKKKVIVSSIF